MSSSQNSPVLVQHASPPHTLSPEVTVVSISTFSPEPQNQSSPLQEPPAEPVLTSAPQVGIELPPPTPEMPDTEMADVPPPNPGPPAELNPEHQQEQEPEHMNTSEEEPQSQAPDVVETEVLSLEGEATTQLSTVPSETPSQETQIPPPPPPVVEERRHDVPEWVTWEDDHSNPTEDEMTEIRLRESRGTELSATDVPSVEKRIYHDVDDPDQRPVKKLRLSWVIKGVRGTKDKPNHARVMVSPPALVDGNYWQIKFYPRGNKCMSLSAYIKCSRRSPKSEIDIPGTFSFFQGSPEADLGDGAVPVQKIEIEPGPKENEHTTSALSTTSSDSQKQDSNPNTEESKPDSSQADESESRDAGAAKNHAEEDWRVSAQLGMVIYNPLEPRTCTYMSSEHQFAKSNDDWGWTNFVGPWRDIHLRQHCQRTPLLQNDTIAIDAYIRIFDDPSQALWWHSSDTESQWDSKTLAGYFPMGTPPLYHSPGVAGVTAWLLLAPFRQVLQNADAGGWRRDSQIRPRPIICHLQMILFLMRSLRRDRETYVDVYSALQALEELGENYTDVKTFWEVLRRTVELELADDESSLKSLSAIFDTPEGPISVPPLPVEGVSDVQQGLEQVLRTENFKGRLPNFLPLSLARQKFDKTSRDWKLLHDRVVLNEELDVSKFCREGEPGRYTLYGFMVHVGERKSGKFYSVLRPGGPNTKWLAFEDGDGNKVFSYTRKRIQDFEGLEGQALKDFTSTRQTAYLAMYVKTDRLQEYLPGELEPYKLPKWLVPYLESQFQEGDDIFAEDGASDESEEVNVEIYSEEGLIGRQGLLDMFNIKQQSQHKGKFHIMRTSKTSTYQDLRNQLAQRLAIGDPEKIRLFLMSYIGMGHYMSAQMKSVCLKDAVGSGRPTGQPLCLWMSTLKNQEELELFGDPDSPVAQVPVDSLQSPQPESASTENSGSSVEQQVAAPDTEQSSVQAAVATGGAQIGSEIGEPSAEEEVIENPDTPMQLEVPPPTAEESLTANVPHGHLINAAAHGDSTPMENATENDGPQEVPNPEETRLSAAEQTITAAANQGDSEAMDFVMSSGTESSENDTSQSAESSESAPASATQRQGPVDNVYGFIQIFEVDKQNFSVHDTFFARCDDKVRDFIRRRMGYDADKELNIWRRESVVDGSAIGPDDTFRDPKFVNGVDLIVSEPIPEARIKELDREGKFSNPFELSKFLRKVDRRHPIESKTTTDPIELADFGTDYYRGHLVNGRFHGENSLWISSNGNTYEGPLVCNQKCGKGGKMTYQNGDTYEGEWDDDERHGQGTFVEHRTGNKYVGGFEYGKRWGMGTTYWKVADEQADLCQICYSAEKDALFFDCGHVCSCVECARQCESCPICRRSIKQVVRMFKA
ncbi:uncharacterized protein Z518_02183 [Rhinocladiella mackenziei CBS 650.93]|uniref:MATH and UCH domain protein n=1 Tax=Rhinocladiella mackenziei CBS 650.93 TaxID=1442369 RepID=A0A0D2JEF1_9EURO|nr:uncharacterized protein Z518_02183 [Rhinocladiella mackenziei CBS 650.93]KIX07530.1 hypothetical protein Z518_02183 [Rhinocladiella mackenziei CBS 650.93]